MLSPDEALDRLLALARPLPGIRVPLADAAGRSLVEPRIVAAHDVPPFANSAMDGFAVRASDAPGSLRVVGESAAGSAPLPALTAGTAVRIMTGAPLPPEADAIVPVELAGEADGTVQVPAVAPGTHVRAAGHDTAAGEEVRLAGELGPAGIAVLASLGKEAVEVRRRPVVGVLSTGDELAEPGAALGPGQIHDANGPALAAAVREAGGEPRVLPRVGDDAAAIERVLREAASEADLVVTSGGVSVGRYDHVRTVLDARGSVDFWRIAVQPGKPLIVGTLDGTVVVGLPGNPVSALVTFELFVRPMLRVMLGLTGDGRVHLPAVATERMTKDPARRAFLRVTAWRDGATIRARPAGGQASSQLRPLADGNALLVVPEGLDAAEPGGTFEIILLAPLAPRAP